MNGFRKFQLAVFLGLAVSLAQEPGVSAQEVDPDEQLDTLFAQLSEPERVDWMTIENQILRLWARSGSPAMDMLLRRGQEAIERQDFAAAVEHLSALTDHAPDFAEGWNARATAYFQLGEYSLSIADIERVLALNPRHFGALAGLGFILNDMGETRFALEALQAAQALNPHRDAVNQAIERLERGAGGAEL